MSAKPESQKTEPEKKPVKRKPTKRKKTGNTAVAAAPAEIAAPSAPEAEESAQPKTAQPSRPSAAKQASSDAKAHHWGRVVLIVLVAVVVVVAGLFAWDRWFRYDDAADMQGEWKVASKQYTVVLDGQAMKLTNDVTYRYTLDPFFKTITYTFASSSGHGSYRFSADRQTLIIEDNAGTDWLVALHLKKDPVLDEGQVGTGVSVLTKVSSNTAASPQPLVNQTTSAANAAGTVLDGTGTTTQPTG